MTRTHSLALALGLCLLGCQKQSSQTYQPTPSSSQPAAGQPPASQQPAHWPAALAALAAAQTPEPLTADSGAVALWNARIAASWPQLSGYLSGLLDAKLQGLLGKGGSNFSIASVQPTSSNLSEVPAFIAGHSAAGESFELRLPASSQGWQLALQLRVDYTLFGGSATLQHFADFDILISGLQAAQQVVVDTSDPLHPAVVSLAPPVLDLQLQISSSHILAGPVLQFLSPLLDVFIRAELAGIVSDIAQQLGTLFSGQGAALGLGGSLQPFLGPRQDLESLAVATDAALVRDHLHFGMVFEALLDQDSYGSGDLTDIWGQGDSAFWTGHYLASLAYRYSLQADPALEARAADVLAAFGRCLDISPQGQLSRVALPLASPFTANMPADHRYFVASLAGTAWVGLDDVSRDQYIGVMLGLGRVHSHMPALRPLAAQLIGRLLEYLDSHGWSTWRNDGIELAASFAQNPLAMLALLQTGKAADPARWSAQFDGWAPMLAVAWLPAWFGTLNTHEEYYKFNLLHDNLVSLCELETSPDRYREYLKILRLERAALAHHQNAWFDAVYAMAVPTQAASIAGLVEDGLQRWGSRPRRGFAVQNSSDPLVPQTLFQFLDPSKPAEWIAAQPLPVERRRFADYLWQRSPFDLDGNWPAAFQAPGIDLLLPFWFARAHGVL